MGRSSSARRWDASNGLTVGLRSNRWRADPGCTAGVPRAGSAGLPSVVHTRGREGGAQRFRPPPGTWTVLTLQWTTSTIFSNARAPPVPLLGSSTGIASPCISGQHALRARDEDRVAAGGCLLATQAPLSITRSAAALSSPKEAFILTTANCFRCSSPARTFCAPSSARARCGGAGRRARSHGAAHPPHSAGRAAAHPHVGHAPSLHLVATHSGGPRLSGVDLARAAVHTRPESPVLLVSRRPTPRDVSHAEHEVAPGQRIDFRAKPFTMGEPHGVVAALRALPVLGER